MHFEERALTSDDGKALHVRSWLPDAPPRAVIQVIHGMAEHGGRYGALAERLAGAGFATYAADQRGHGQTAKSEAELGFLSERDGWSRVLADIHHVGAFVRERHPRLARCVLGHSGGSFFAQSYLLAHPRSLDALVLSGTKAGGGLLTELGRLVARVERLRGGPRGRSSLIERLSFSAYNRAFAPNRTKADWLSRDAEQVDLYLADPRCGFRSTNQLWTDQLDALASLGRARLDLIPKDLPVYVLFGEKCAVSGQYPGAKELVQAYRAAGLSRVTQRVYPGARHECFHEVNRAEVIADLVGWLEANLARA